jgi:hypothetical protein
MRRFREAVVPTIASPPPMFASAVVDVPATIPSPTLPTGSPAENEISVGVATVRIRGAVSDGLDLDRGLFADWVGRAAWLLRPLAERIGQHVMAALVIHADDTPVPALAPGNGKTKTGRLWLYLRDERPHAGPAPPAVLYCYTPDRKAARILPASRGPSMPTATWVLLSFTKASGGSADVTEVACWAHVRRGFFDVAKSNGSTIAQEALARIGALFDIERTIASESAERRRCVRWTEAGPKLDDLAAWLEVQLRSIPGNSELAQAIRYACSRWTALTAYVGDGRFEISNNAAENAIRPVTLGRNYAHLPIM